MEKEHPFSDDYQLWQSFKAGSEKAFDQIYATCFSALYGYGTRLCGDKDLVKDCIQSLFVELWHHRGQVADVHSVRYYLYRCLRRKIIRAYNEEKKLVHSDDLPEGYHFEVSFSHEIMLVNDQLNEENQRKLLRAFTLLTQRQKEAVYLRFYDNASYEEIASIMSLKEVKYARTLIYRALDVLRASIRRLASV
jgi:RNA polymerase sigma-70 factor (ECF subfamily)